MKVGIFVTPTTETLPMVELARQVEALGFESLWVPDHPVMPRDMTTKPPGGGEMADYYRRLMDPFMALAAAAGATRRIVQVLPFAGRENTLMQIDRLADAVL